MIMYILSFFLLLHTGDREKSMGLPVAPFMDKTATTVPKNSMNFIDYVATPLFKGLGKLDKKFDQEVVQVSGVYFFPQYHHPVVV